MSRYTGPKARLCRREGINLFGPDKYQKILQNKPGTPGVHGRGIRKKNTQYGNQLREKQKARAIFGITEKQLSNYFKKATRISGDTGEQFLQLLERRLDNALFKAGFTKTRMQARQLISHGHVTVNELKCNIPSRELKIGDKVQIKEKTQKNILFKESFNDKYRAPSWLKVDNKSLSISIEAFPTKNDFESLIETHLIVEFYSR
jgi:small subunit ribosomal protein S4